MTPSPDIGADVVPLDPDTIEVDLDAYIAACQPRHRLMGFYLYAVYRELVRHGVRTGVPAWHPFHHYPLVDGLRLALAARTTIYAQDSTARALYYLGADAMRSFTHTTFGRLVASGRSPAAVLGSAHQGRTVEGGRTEVIERAERRLVLLVHDRPIPAIAYLGAMDALASVLVPGSTLRAALGPERAMDRFRLSFTW